MTFGELTVVDGLLGPFDVSTERYREYYWPETGQSYRINDPVALYRREGGTTHRVVDITGMVHCVPCGKDHPNTIIRWLNKDLSVPVNW